MKKVLTAIFTMVLTFPVLAQDYVVEGTNVVFTKIIEETNLTIADAHNLLESYFAIAYNDVNNTCKLNQENHLIYKGNYSLLEQSFNTYVRAEHTLDVAIKDNRVRVKISVDNMIFRGGTQGVYDYMIVNAAPINEGRQPFNVTKKMALGYFEKLCTSVNSTFDGIDKALKKQLDTTDDDW